MTAFSRRLLLGGAASALAAPRVLAQTRDSITLAMPRDLQGLLDPAFRLSTPEANVLRAVCEGLLRFKPGSFEWEPAAAERVEPVSDTAIDFALRPGLHFQDGFGELTAEDVKFSFERFRAPGPDGKPSAYAADMETLDRVEVTGKHTGRIHLTAPSPALWKVVLPDVSGLIVSRRAMEAGAYRTDRSPARVIGTGAYTLAEWVPNQRTVLRADPAYHGPAPRFREIVLRPVRDPKTAELALRADELQFSRIEPSSAAAVQGAPRTRVLSQDSINFVWLGMNVERAPFDDVRVRRALRAAIDVDQVLAGGYDGAVGRAYGPLAPGLVGHWPQAPRHRADPALARRLLAEAGHGRGVRAKLTLLNQPAYQAGAQVIQALAAEAGFQLQLEVLDPGAYWSAGNGERGKEIQLALQRFGGKADPAFQMQWFTSDQVGTWNWQRWRSPEYDAAVARAARTEDTAERQRLYVEAQRIMDESAAFVWLTHERNVFAFRDWLSPALLPNGDDMLLDRFAAV